ncbi:MAG TPA: hypothetical protein VMI54_21500 [Polyangiaceae bacterium]|nr:hypothetical protein [Polyangiaceae bacterium]
MSGGSSVGSSGRGGAAGTTAHGGSGGALAGGGSSGATHGPEGGAAGEAGSGPEPSTGGRGGAAAKGGGGGMTETGGRGGNAATGGHGGTTVSASGSSGSGGEPTGAGGKGVVVDAGAAGEGGAGGAAGGGNEGGAPGSPVDCLEIGVSTWNETPPGDPVLFYSYLSPNVGSSGEDEIGLLAYSNDVGIEDFSQVTSSSCFECLNVDIPDPTSSILKFVATKGTLDIADSSEPLSGVIDATLTDITLVEADSLNQPIPGGYCLHLASAHISLDGQ